MKKYILITLLSLSSFAAMSQNDKEMAVSNQTDAYKPQKGSYTVSLLMGRGSYIEQGGTYVGNSHQVSGQAPYVNTINSNNNSLMNMAGVEGKYFISDKMALSLNGGFTFRTTPSSVNIPSNFRR
ncbi:BT1926 family outer membrane beta-barrel protein [Tenacibaculum finnmarkense]|nr:BT1926 family outer membrane beta-barrel protein [Tenacibaculum finnmarkense]